MAESKRKRTKKMHPISNLEIYQFASLVDACMEWTIFKRLGLTSEEWRMIIRQTDSSEERPRVALCKLRDQYDMALSRDDLIEVLKEVDERLLEDLQKKFNWPS